MTTTGTLVACSEEHSKGSGHARKVLMEGLRRGRAIRVPLLSFARSGDVRARQVFLGGVPDPKV